MTTAGVTPRRIRRDRASETVAALRRSIDTLNRIPPFRSAGRGVVYGLIRASFALLRASPSLRAVYLRGSHGRGDAEPFSSDVDLAIVLGEREPTFEVARDVLRRLRWARRLNPLIRDAWQFVAGEREWPLLLRHARLIGLDEWRDENGERPTNVGPPVPPRLRLAALSNRQQLWTTQALRTLLSPGERSTADGLLFAGAEKKALTLAGDVLGTPAPRRRRPPPRTDAVWIERAAALLLRLDECAAAVSSRVGLWETGEPKSEPAVEAKSAAEVLRTASRWFDVPATFSRVLLHAGALVFVTHERPSSQETVALLGGLAELVAALGRPCLLQTPASLALALLIEPIAVVTPASTSISHPGLLREQLFYEALFHGADLRVLAERPPPPRGHPLLTIKLARAIVYFRDERLVRDAESAVAQATADDAELTERLRRPSLTERDWFAVNARLWAGLLDLLERAAPASENAPRR